MGALPVHVALDDEAIPAPSARHRDGPDLRGAMPVEQMLDLLKPLADDAVGYLKLWRRFLACAGIDVTLSYERDGDESLMMGGACNGQERQRSRYIHFLGEDLKADDGERRQLLITQLLQEGRYSDNRPADPRGTTLAVRDFLAVGGRLLIDPNGKLTEGAGVPRSFASGSDAEAAECVRASRSYFSARRRWRSTPQIKRAVRMLGRPTDNGWLVLEARS